jgi:hypothetical protein
MSETPMFEMSPNTRLIRQRLRAMEIGELITYTDLGAIISKPVDGATGCLRSAIDSLLRKEQMVFAAVRSVGMKRLNDTDIVSASDADVSSIRRKAKKAVRKLTSVKDYNAMPGPSRLAHTARVSVLAAMVDMSTDRSIEKIEKAAVGQSSALPFGDTLRAFLP